MTLFRKLIILALASVFFLTGGTGLVQAKTKTPAKAKAKTSGYLRVFYYQEGKKARQSFADHLGSVDVLAPQTYSIDSSGELAGKVNENILALARKNKIKVMPLIINKGFSMNCAQAFLDDPVKQDKAIGRLITEALKQSYWGWQVDFENIDASYRDKFSAFIKKLYGASRANRLILSVAVVAQSSGNPDDYPKQSWQNIVGVFDYAALAGAADFISIMSYDDPWSKGPIARYAWINQVLDYATRYIPHKKISLGIPLYYWEWNNATNKRVGIGGYAGILKVLNKYRARLGYDSVAQAPYISYTKKKKNYTIWYENAKSIEKKIGLIRKYDLHGFSAWSLGLETPSVYNAVKI